MSVSKFNPNRDIDGLEFKRDSFKGQSTADRDQMFVHRSPETGRLVLHCSESRRDYDYSSNCDLVFDAEDARALADWILEKFPRSKPEGK